MRRIKAKFTGSVVHSTLPETTLNISNFLVEKSSLRQMANFVNCPGDYTHKSGDQKKWLKMWRLQT